MMPPIMINNCSVVKNESYLLTPEYLDKPICFIINKTQKSLDFRYEHPVHFMRFTEFLGAERETIDGHHYLKIQFRVNSVLKLEMNSEYETKLCSATINGMVDENASESAKEVFELLNRTIAGLEPSQESSRAIGESPESHDYQSSGWN